MTVEHDLIQKDEAVLGILQKLSCGEDFHENIWVQWRWMQLL